MIITALRITLRSLKILQMMDTWRPSQRVPSEVLRAAGVMFFTYVSVELHVLGIQSVVGMLVVFVVLMAIQLLVGSGPADLVYRSLEPGKNFLVKWATLFFAPALVKIPLVHMHFSFSVFFKWAILLLGGCIASLMSTAGIACLFPQTVTQPAPAVVTAPAVQAASAATSGTESTAIQGKPPRAVDSRPYKKRLLAIYAVCMVAALVTAYAQRDLVKTQIALNAFMLASSLLGFVGGMLSPKRVQAVVHPMFACILATWAAAAAWGPLSGGANFQQVLKTYDTWPGGGAMLTFLLGPTVVALGVLLFERRSLLRGELLPVVVTCTLSALLSMTLTACFARALSLPRILGVSALLRCISSPFAGDLVGLISADATLAIAMIVVTGFIGIVLAPPIFRLLRLKNPRARGLAMGASAHGLGTVAMATSDPDAFPYSALALVLVGTASSVFVQVPFIRTFLVKLATG